MGPQPKFSLTPNLDKNEQHIQKMKPHMITAASITSGMTDVCIMLNRLYIEIQKMNMKLDALTPLDGNEYYE